MNQRALNLIIAFGLAYLITSCATSHVAERPPQRTPTRKPPPEHVQVGKSAPLEYPPIPQIDTGGHKALIRDVIFTKDGRYLVSASEDKTVRVWDVRTGDTLRIIRGQIGKGNEGKIFAATLAPDNRRLAVGGILQDGGFASSTSPPAGSNACSRAMRMSSYASIFQGTAVC